MQAILIEKIIRKYGKPFPEYLSTGSLVIDPNTLIHLLIDGVHLVVEDINAHSEGRFWVWSVEKNEKGKYWSICPPLSDKTIVALYTILIKDPDLIMELL